MCRQEEFLRITADQLKSLVKSDVLNVRSEEKVYEALLKWVKHDVDARHQYIPDLMQVKLVEKLDATLVSFCCKFYLMNTR